VSDILAEISRLTDIEFEAGTDKNTTWVEILEKLETGDVAMVSELRHNEKREEDFLWADVPYFTFRNALLSKADYPDLEIYQVIRTIVGVVKGSASEQLFDAWFPHNTHTKRFDTQHESFDALDRGEIDLFMAPEYTLLFQMNYREKPGYKANIVFNTPIQESFLGFNRNEEILRSIISKAQRHVNTDRIVKNWTSRIYDYSRKMEQERFFYLAVSAAVLALTLVILAISYRKDSKKSRTIAEQSAMLAAIYDSFPAMVFSKDLNGLYTSCNRKFEEETGSPKSEIIGKTFAELALFSDKSPQKFFEADQKAIRENITVTTEDWYLFPDKSRKPMEVIRAPLIQNGKAAGLLGIALDITERRMASNYEYANELSSALAKITTSPTISAGILKDAADIISREGCAALNATRAGIWIKTHEVNILKSISCYDISTGEYIVQDDFDLSDYMEYTKLLGTERIIIANDVKTSKELSGLLDGYGPNLCALLDIPIRIDGKLAGTVTIEQDSCETFSENREWTIAELNFASSLADLMALAISGTERRKAREDAEIANRAKSKFLATMSHEIRTPMNSIMGFTELAQDAEIPVKTRDYLGKIQTNAEWLLQIINDILDISKIESGKMELERISFDMHELFASCRTVIMPKAFERGIMLHFYAEPSIGIVPLGDPTRLRQVLVNLLSNAVKFTNTGMVKLHAKIKHISEKTVTMNFEIKDSGIGMTPEQMERVFEPFTQAESGTTRKFGGTGLGLAITKNIIELMGGTLSVESTPGIGSKFSFTLTFDAINATDDMFEKIILNELEKPSFEGEILLCEDNVMNQQVICEHLARVGLKTVVAENGLIGLEMVKSRVEKGEKQFDLIFMDMHMPVMDGLEASEKILELNVEIPIVAMTANIMSNDREIYRTHGINDCVGKPFTSQELWRCLMKYFKPVSWQTTNETQRMRAENELRNRLITNFVKDNRTRFGEITEAISAGDIKLAHRLAHTLKSNAGQLGKTILQQAAANVEYQLKDGENLVTPQHMTILETELSVTLAEFEQMLDESQSQPETAAQAESLDAQSALELIIKLEPMLEMGNPECREHIDILRRIPGSEGLIRQIEDLDFEPAIVTLAELKKKLATA